MQVLKVKKMFSSAFTFWPEKITSSTVIKSSITEMVEACSFSANSRVVHIYNMNVSYLSNSS